MEKMTFNDKSNEWTKQHSLTEEQVKELIRRKFNRAVKKIQLLKPQESTDRYS